MASGQLLITVTFCCLVFICVNFAASMTEGNFKTILQGRCEDYKEIFKPSLAPSVSCARATTKFDDIFASTKPGYACKNTSYQDFVNYVKHDVPSDKGLLWSGVHDEMKQIALDGDNFYPIRLTFAGYMLDDIDLCDKVYTGRTACTNCKKGSATRAFWEKASEYYARSLSGNVTIMLSSRDITFYSGSILSRIEIPSLTTKVKFVRVWPLKDLDYNASAKIEKCGEGSLKTLENTIKNSGRAFACEVNVKMVLFAQCLRKPHKCSSPRVVSGSESLRSLPAVLVVAIFVKIITVGKGNF